MALMTVVPFGRPPAPPKTKLYWTCAQCGCLSWYVFEDSTIECASCGQISVDHGGEWRSKLPDPPANPEPLEPGGHQAVIDLNCAGAAKQRHLGKAKNDDNVLLARVDREGEVGVWSEGWASEEQRLWMHSRIERIKEIFDRQKATPSG